MRNSFKSFNCSTNCEGIYADVQYVGKKVEEDEESEIIETGSSGKVDEETNKLLKRIAQLERKMEMVESAFGEKGEEVDKNKYKMLIAEYRRFKAKHVKPFRFKSAANSRDFGQFKTIPFTVLTTKFAL